MALSAAAIGGIVAGGVVALILLAFLFAYMRMRDGGNSSNLMQQVYLQNMASQSAAPPIYLPEPAPEEYPTEFDEPYIDEERVTPRIARELVRNYEEREPPRPRTPPRPRDTSPSRIVVELDDEPQEILRVTRRRRRSADPDDTIAARQRRQDRERNRSWKLIHRIVHGEKKKRATDDCHVEKKMEPQETCQICWENGERGRCGHHSRRPLQHYDLAVDHVPCQVHNVCKAYKAPHFRNNRVMCTSGCSRPSRNTTGGMMIDSYPNNNNGVDNSMAEQEQTMTLTEDF